MHTHKIELNHYHFLLNNYYFSVGSALVIMVAIPLGKLLYLGIKQLSRPISIQLKAAAKNSQFVSRYICSPPAQGRYTGNWVRLSHTSQALIISLFSVVK